MKYLLLFLLSNVFSQSYGQTYPALEATLAKELAASSTTDGRWVFYPDKASIRKIEKPLVSAVMPTYQFYSVTLTNYLGYHVNQGTCLVLYDTTKDKIQLVEPLWYGGVNEQFVRLFLGKRFQTKGELTNFLKEVHELMEVGSGYRFVTTGSSSDTLTYDLGYSKGDSYTTGGNGTSSTVNYNQDGVWRKIIIDIKDLKLVGYTSINPATKDKEFIR